jgi:hypothetical protein
VEKFNSSWASGRKSVAVNINNNEQSSEDSLSKRPKLASNLNEPQKSKDKVNFSIFEIAKGTNKTSNMNVTKESNLNGTLKLIRVL